MPATSDTRPSKLAGPTVRQRKPATVAESSGGRAACANAAEPDTATAATSEMYGVSLIEGRGRGRNCTANWNAERCAIVALSVVDTASNFLRRDVTNRCGC